MIQIIQLPLTGGLFFCEKFLKNDNKLLTNDNFGAITMVKITCGGI